MKYIEGVFDYAKRIIADPETRDALTSGIALSAIGASCLAYSNFSINNISTMIGGDVLAGAAVSFSFILVEPPKSLDCPTRPERSFNKSDPRDNTLT